MSHLPADQKPAAALLPKITRQMQRFFARKPEDFHGVGVAKRRPVRMVLRTVLAAGVIAGAAYLYSPKAWEADRESWPTRQDVLAESVVMTPERAQELAQSGGYGWLRATERRTIQDYIKSFSGKADEPTGVETRRMVYHHMGLNPDFTAWHESRYAAFREWMENDLWHQDNYDNWADLPPLERLARLQKISDTYMEMVGGEKVKLQGFTEAGFYYPFVDNVQDWLKEHGPVTHEKANELRQQGYFIDFAVRGGDYQSDHLALYLGRGAHYRLYKPQALRGETRGVIRINMHDDADFNRYPAMIGSVVYNTAMAYSHQLIERMERGEITPDHPAWEQARIFRFNQMHPVDALEWPATYQNQPFIRFANEQGLDAEYKGFHMGRLDRHDAKWRQKQNPVSGYPKL